MSSFMNPAARGGAGKRSRANRWAVEPTPIGASSEDAPGPAAQAAVDERMVVPPFPQDRKRTPLPERVLKEDSPELNQFVDRAPTQLVTGDGHALSLPQRHREIAAFVLPGHFFISTEDILSPEVTSLWERVWREGFSVQEILYVPPSMLMQIYESHARYTAGRGGVHETISEAQEKFESILKQAVKFKASDVHITLRKYDAKVQFRIDGWMEDYDRLHKLLGQQMFRAIYYLCDDSEGSTLRFSGFQEGRISGGKIVLPEGLQNLRLQFNQEASRGHHLAIRLLYANSTVAGSDVDHLGYAQFQLRQIQFLRSRPHGLNLVSGITGSGKSTTLQRILSSLLAEREGRINMITIEDPPEYEIPGAHQFPVVAVDGDRSSGFLKAMMAAMRSDPDVLMVGEIRDPDTAHLAIQCSYTGHLVWTTIHATSALRSIARLNQEGVARHQLMDAGVVTGAIGQRLVPQLCRGCSIPLDEALRRRMLDARPGFSEQLSEFLEPLRHGGREYALEGIRVRNPDSETRCQHAATRVCRKGYSGRVIVAEVATITEGLIEAFCHDDEGLSISHAQEHWLTQCDGIRMMEHGFMRLLGGEVDPTDAADLLGYFSIEQERMDLLVSKAESEGFLDVARATEEEARLARKSDAAAAHAHAVAA